jgi:hypothetical protein
MVTPAARRDAVAHLRTSLEVSERRACAIVAVDRSTVRYRAKRPDDAALRARLRELADQRRRFGYRRLHVLLRGEGWTMNRKKTQRLYGEEGLAVRRRRSRRRIAVARTPIPRPEGPNSRWSTDFVHDQLANGRRVRVLTIIDDVTKECLAAVPDTSLSGKRVVREMQALIGPRGRPGAIVSDNVLCREAWRVPGRQVPSHRQIADTAFRLNQAAPAVKEAVSPIANTGSARLPSPSSRRDPKPRRKTRTLSTRSRLRLDGLHREGSSRLDPPLRRRDGSRRRA